MQSLNIIAEQVQIYQRHPPFQSINSVTKASSRFGGSGVRVTFMIDELVEWMNGLRL
jgi:hypothetical protein